jgi:hypothetical protein
MSGVAYLMRPPLITAVVYCASSTGRCNTGWLK